MADPTQFNHDRLGHLLSDRLLRVPRFQRRYSWQDEHVAEFWSDIQRARTLGNSYFMGTVVLTKDSDDPKRHLIIDGQQRITTTAILFVAIRDRLLELGKEKLSQGVESDYLSDYVLTEEETIAKLVLSPDDHVAFSALLERRDGGKNLVSIAYGKLKANVDALSPTADDYRRLIDLVKYLEDNVQVLLAVAVNIAEAYIIFETLNDRGADLTTADLLKNFLFSEAGDSGIAHAEAVWTRVSGRFDKPEELVKFLRYEYMSRKGRVTNRALYKALQADIGHGAAPVRRYLEGVEQALGRYVALREPDDATWSPQAVEVKDSLLAFRRFGFESSMPLLLAAFECWSHTDATRFVDLVASWSVRAWVAGKIGGGEAEGAFCNAAVAVTSGSAADAQAVRSCMLDLVPSDDEFRQQFIEYGAITTTRAKYILARLERQAVVDSGSYAEAMPDWSSKGVSVEHIFPKSLKREKFSNDADYGEYLGMKEKLQNLTLLERSLNNGLEDKPFEEKKATYASSAFGLTQDVGSLQSWSFTTAATRARVLADLAVRAWPL
ncbi:MAG: DUF262 domain-containing protein [Pseudonocardia sp.]